MKKHDFWELLKTLLTVFASISIYYVKIVIVFIDNFAMLQNNHHKKIIIINEINLHNVPFVGGDWICTEKKAIEEKKSTLKHWFNYHLMWKGEYY